MPWYKTGTITLNNGSPNFTGAGTSWVDVGTLNPGDVLLAPDGNFYEILTLASNTGGTLVSNYLGTNVAGAAYAIIPIGLLPSTLAQQVKSTLTTANTALSSAVRYDTNAQGLSSTQKQNARTNIAALSAADVGYGYLSKSVAGNVDVNLTATEAAYQFIEFTGVLTGNISVIVPAAARLWGFYNNTSGAYTLTVKTAAGTGIAITQGKRTILECDGTNIVQPVDSLAALTVSGALVGGAGSRIDIGSDANGDMYYRAAGVLARLAKGAANLKMFMNPGASAPEWATGSKIGTFTRDLTTADGNVSITGVGFKPEIIVLLSGVDQVNMAVGVSDGTTNFSLSTGFSTNRVTSNVILAYPSSGNYQIASVASLDADGFTLSWTKSGSPTGMLSCTYLAIR